MTAECPGCGADVSGCSERVSREGRRVFVQPVSAQVLTDGRERLTGGLVHVVGGERCRSDAGRRG